MSVTTNVITKFKQLFYNAGDTPAEVDSAVDGLNQKEVIIALDSATTNVSVNYKASEALSLASATFSATVATASTAANTVTFAISTNGTEVASLNTDGASMNAVAVGDIYDFTVDTANASVAAGEYVVVSCAHESGNAAGGIVTLRFDRA